VAKSTVHTLLRLRHSNRMDETRWQRKVPEGVPQEKSKRGRPRRGWKDVIKEQRKQGTALKKSVTEGKSADWGRRNGDSCKIIRKYVCVYI
jgi:hypothetical protein